MYEELIKDLRYCANPDAPCSACKYLDIGCDMAIAEKAAVAIEELLAERDEVNADSWKTAFEVERDEHRWIPVTERLPECKWGAEVGNIEWISCGMVHAGCFGRGGKYRDAYFRTWTDAGEGMDAKDADYWRAVTIPEPPKEET